MKKGSRKIIGARNLSKQIAAGEDPIHSPESEHSNIDAFYQRMFVGVASLRRQTLREQNENRDIYLHLSEVSVAMIGVCLTGVSILNVDEDINTLNIYVHNLLAIDSFVFLTAYLLSYWLVRVMTRGDRNVRRVGNIANAIFLIGMVFMAIICICVVCQGNYTPKLDDLIAKQTSSF